MKTKTSLTKGGSSKNIAGKKSEPGTVAQKLGLLDDLLPDIGVIYGAAGINQAVLDGYERLLGELGEERALKPGGGGAPGNRSIRRSIELIVGNIQIAQEDWKIEGEFRKFLISLSTWLIDVIREQCDLLGPDWPNAGLGWLDGSRSDLEDIIISLGGTATHRMPAYWEDGPTTYRVSCEGRTAVFHHRPEDAGLLISPELDNFVAHWSVLWLERRAVDPRLPYRNWALLTRTDQLFFAGDVEFKKNAVELGDPREDRKWRYLSSGCRTRIRVTPVGPAIRAVGTGGALEVALMNTDELILCDNSEEFIWGVSGGVRYKIPRYLVAGYRLFKILHEVTDD